MKIVFAAFRMALMMLLLHAALLFMRVYFRELFILPPAANACSCHYEAGSAMRMPPAFRHASRAAAAECCRGLFLQCRIGGADFRWRQPPMLYIYGAGAIWLIAARLLLMMPHFHAAAAIIIFAIARMRFMMVITLIFATLRRHALRVC